MFQPSSDGFVFATPTRSIVCVVGTRPEVIKMAPIITRLKNTRWAVVHVVATGQQNDLLENALEEFGLHANYVIEHDRSCCSPALFLSRLTEKLDKIFTDLQPHCVIAQGDTTSVYASSIVAFYKSISFVHVEAGLRTPSLDAPFPEEFHRRAISISTALHCAPTSSAAENLLREHVSPEKIVVSGNTVIDALLKTAASSPPAPQGFSDLRTILLTAHRRENFGAPLREAFTAIRAFVDMTPDIAVFFPVHPNPNAKDAAYEIFSGHPRIQLVKPLGYRDMVAAMQRAWCIVTDSGGIQEEAPALGKPVLVLRDVTERPEAVLSGVVEIVGTSRERVFNALIELNKNTSKYNRMARAVFPYGDGHASQLIVEALSKHLASSELAPHSAQIISLPRAS